MAFLSLLLVGAIWQKSGITSKIPAAGRPWVAVYKPPSHCLHSWSLQRTGQILTCLKVVTGSQQLGGAYSITERETQSWIGGGTFRYVGISRHSQWGTPTSAHGRGDHSLASLSRLNSPNSSRALGRVGFPLSLLGRTVSKSKAFTPSKTP